MKKWITTLLLMLVAVPVYVFAQAPDTVYVPNDNNMGTINSVIQGDTTATGARNNPNRVYLLHRGGFYQLNGALTTKPGTHIYLIGDPPPYTADSSMPVIIEGPATGVYYYFTLDCFGDLTMKNIWMIYATTLGTKNWTDLQFETDSLKTTGGPRGDFDNCIFDWATGIAVTANCAHFTGTFNNCIFRNEVDPTQWWAGRQFATVSSAASVDSVASENCTFENLSFAFQTDYTPPKRCWYNHNTFVNVCKFPFKFYWFTHLVCANSIFYNCHFTGERYNDRIGQDPDNLLWGTTIDVDTIPTGTTYNGVSELNRVLIFMNNSNFSQAVFDSFYTAYNDTVKTLQGKILAEPSMNARTLDMFTWHPLFKMDKFYDGSDPKFVNTPSQMDSMIAFLHQRYVGGAGGNVDWSYDENYGAWPPKENLTYTNDTLLTAAMGGYPLGDLYHWFPDKYTTWKAQQVSEDAALYRLTAVKERPGEMPVGFALDQNYPNPFNPATKINYTVPKNGFVTLKVYNVLGQEVATLYSGMQRIGNYQATFDGSRFASGVYFYRLQSGNVSMTRKMILIK